jgi:hypothetical protein
VNATGKPSIRKPQAPANIAMQMISSMGTGRASWLGAFAGRR